ncbi:MAG: hypothetical protein V2I97_16090 [Desulfococcaceae bacterium]|nr:hypothetical protein [Desulfococcaceae bacterium]
MESKAESLIRSALDAGGKTILLWCCVSAFSDKEFIWATNCTNDMYLILAVVRIG